MPEPDPNVVVEPQPAVVVPAVPAQIVRKAPLKGLKAGDVLITPFTCEWAQDGLLKALEGMSRSSSGVLEYHIGSRGLKRMASKDQLANIDYWNKMVELYCGTAPLPPGVTGRSTACRIIPRDV